MLSHNMAIYIYKQERSCLRDRCAMLHMPLPIRKQYCTVLLIVVCILNLILLDFSILDSITAV